MDVKTDFDKAASHWDEDPGRVKLAKDIAGAILKAADIGPDTVALDYGCGTGLLTLGLQPYVRHITGMDSSQGMLDILNRKIRQFSLGNVSSTLFDLEKGGSLERGYDLVTCSMTLHHSENPDLLIQKLSEGLRPGGYLCLADLDPDGGKFHGDNRGVLHFGFERSFLLRNFAESGLADVRIATAAEVAKKDDQGEMRIFSVFLIVGQRPASSKI